jgi:hypothetical protein
MTPAQVRTAVPILYGIAVVVVALTAPGIVLTVVAVVGAMLLGLFYAVTSGDSEEGGRHRNRNRGHGGPSDS